jgi:hypothetical protein
MTVTNPVCQNVFIGDGVTTSFAFNFEIPYQADGVTPAVTAVLTVGMVKTTLVLGTDFSIAGVESDTGGTVTYPLSGSPMANPNTLTITRSLAYTQPDAFPNQGSLPQNTEAALDNLAFQIQQLNQRLVNLGG